MDLVMLPITSISSLFTRSLHIVTQYGFSFWKCIISFYCECVY